MIAKAVHQEGGWHPISDVSDGGRGVEDVERGLGWAAEVVAEDRTRVDIAPWSRARILVCEVVGSIERNDTAAGQIVSCVGHQQGEVTGYRSSHEEGETDRASMSSSDAWALT